MTDIDRNKVDIMQTILGICGVDIVAEKIHETGTKCQYRLSLEDNSRRQGRVWFSMPDNPIGTGSEVELILDIPKGEESTVDVCRTLIDAMMLGKIDGIYHNDIRNDRTTCLFKTPRFGSLNELRIHLDLITEK